MNVKLREQQKCVYLYIEGNGRFGFKVASEILRHDQHTAIPGGRIHEIRFFGLRTLTMAASILKIVISRNANCDNMVGFPKSSHIIIYIDMCTYVRTYI